MTARRRRISPTMNKSAWNWRFSAAATYAVLLIFATHLPAQSLPPSITIADKLAHLGCYAVLGLLAFSAAGLHWRRRNQSADWGAYAAIVAALVAFAAIDESTQYFSPGRVPDVLDWLANVCGILCGGLLYTKWRQVFSYLGWVPSQ